MILVNLDGYFRDPKDLPSKKGIYVVTACRESWSAIYEARIIYIGQADDIKSRHFKNGSYCHERLADFNNECKNGEKVFYSYAEIDGRSLDKVENALVAMQQPPLNSSLKNSYNHCADKFCIQGVGSDDFNFQNFGFSKDYDISSLYTEDDILFE